MKVRVPNIKLSHGYLKAGTVLDVIKSDDDYFTANIPGFGLGYFMFRGCAHLDGADWIILSPFCNREILAHFIKENNIRTTLVSRYLGYSKGWLTQAMNRKDRGDLDANELQDIMDKLHIDWESTEYVHVKATKQHTAYKTKPCSHTTELHKARLQQSFWNGEFTHG